jgi:hypothetical protein
MARDEVFLRPPNHLNPMLTDVAKLVPYKDAVYGEDLDWTIRMAKNGFLTHEYKTDDSRIHYMYNMGTRNVHPETLQFQQQTSYETMLSIVLDGSNRPQVPQPRDPFPTLRLTPRGFVSK